MAPNPRYKVQDDIKTGRSTARTSTDTNWVQVPGEIQVAEKSPASPPSNQQVPRECQVENQKLDSHRHKTQQVPRELPAKSVERCLAMEHQVPRDQQQPANS